MRDKKGFYQGALVGALVVLLLVGLVSCGARMSTGRNSGSTGSGSSVSSGEVLDEEELSKLAKMRTIIGNSYLYDVDEEDLVEGVYAGYVAGLDEPYSVYYDEEATKSLMDDTSGEYEGIGAVLSQDVTTGVITALTVYPDSPAEKGGLRDGDIIYKVGDMEVTGEDLSEVVTYIKGEKGTEVELTVYRGEDYEELTLTIVRDTVQAITVSYEMKEDGVGYLALSEFDTVSYEQYKEALDALEAEGMQGLIVDLRNNPGGNLSTVCEIVDLMIPKGLIVYTEDKYGNRQEYSSDGRNEFTKPLVVLVNGNSASASEIYAGAIQDYGTGKIVGTQTYGKGVVQQLFDLGDGTSVKLTVSQYFTPNGRNIQDIGITPDVEVEYEADEEDPDADNQLDEAISVLKKMM